MKAGAIVAALLVAVIGVWQLSKARTYQLFGEIVPRVQTQRKVVALTFDDGPSPPVRELLGTLRAKKVHATFFLIGGGIAEDPEDARRIVAEGHQVGNHSWSHTRMVFKWPGFIAREIEDTDRLIRQAGYTGEIQFRAPYGKKLVGLPWYLARHHRKDITWDVEPESDPKIDGHTDRIIADVLARARPGSIILLHPMYRNRAPTRAAVGPIIDGLRARGYEFVTVNELLKR
ncbi:MAG TPA: polysaccharide deacetylase family protein [Thermoanaerobaculia bacterium]|nr:polysaccharide deacetylase family protein [Thermoanaerobaculia bacterium]